MLKYLVNNQVFGGNLFWWILLFWEFDFEVIVKQSRLTSRTYQLSRHESGLELMNLDDIVIDAKLFFITMFDDKYMYRIKKSFGRLGVFI